ncbi:MAG: methylated-DNA--[protein]-cysteine S-methyltransferase [Magnetococcus sp. XQGC-1]
MGKKRGEQGEGDDPAAILSGKRPVLLLPLLSPTFAAIRTRQGAVTALYWATPSSPIPPADPVLLAQVREWLADYFAGRFRAVDFPLLWEGTPFQQRLGQALAAIPPGQTVFYGTLARQLQTSPRAIGRGVGSNPLPLLLPCHRVVASTGLGGYSAPGGTASKAWLLEWERKKSKTLGDESPRPPLFF